MSRKIQITLFCLFTLLFIFPGSAYASPPIKKTTEIKESIEIDVPVSTLNKDAGIEAGQGISVYISEDAEDVEVKINVNPNANRGFYYGILAEKGGSVKLDKTIINASYRLNESISIYGISASSEEGESSYIEIGDNSEIYAKSAAVLSTGKGSKVVIGDSAKLSVSTHERSTIEASGGSVEVGDNAQIVNDGTLLGTTQTHVAIDAYNGGTISIGSNSAIIAKGNYWLNNGVNAGSDTGSDPDNKKIGTVRLGSDVSINVSGSRWCHGIYAYGKGSIVTSGERLSVKVKGGTSYGILNSNGANVQIGAESRIEMEGNSAYGIRSDGEDSYLELGEKSEIITSGDNAYGVISSKEGEVSLGNNVEITTLGENAHVIYIWDSGTVEIGTDSSLKASGVGAGVFYFEGTLSESPVEYKDLNAESAHANLITNDTGEALNISFTGNSILKGNLQGNLEPDDPDSAKPGSDISMALYNSSTWEGSGIESEDVTLALELYDDTKWYLVGDSYLDNLTMSSQTQWVEFVENDSFKVLDLGNLSGRGSILMNVNLDDENDKAGDVININTASGEFEVSLNHNDEGGADKLSLIFIESGTPQFTLSTGSNIQIGMHVYELVEEPLQNQGSVWSLRMIKRDNNIADDLKSGLLALFEFAKSIDASLSDELMKPKDDVWLLSFYKLQKFSHPDLASDFKQQLIGGIVGLDQDITEHLSIGEFFGLNVGYQNLNENGSTGYISSLAAGAYINYNKRGFNANTYIRISNYTHDLKLKKVDESMLKETLNTFGFSVSGQLSQKIFIGDGGFFLEPKVKASYTYLLEKEYNVGGTDIKNVSENGLVLWLGMKVGMLKEADDKPYNLYAEAGWIHDFNPSVTYVILEDAEDRSVSIGKNRFEVGIGFEVSPFEASKFEMELKYSKGQGLTEPIKVKIGGSVNF